MPLQVKIKSPEGGTLKTANTYIENDINIVPNLQNKTITQNGEYTADEGYAGLGNINIQVAGEGGVDTSQDTVKADTMLEGTTAHDASGEVITGTIMTYDGAVSGGIVPAKLGQYGVRLSNIWFGEDPPEDNTKLWVECDIDPTIFEENVIKYRDSESYDVTFEVPDKNIAVTYTNNYGGDDQYVGTYYDDTTTSIVDSGEIEDIGFKSQSVLMLGDYVDDPEYIYIIDLEGYLGYIYESEGEVISTTLPTPTRGYFGAYSYITWNYSAISGYSKYKFVYVKDGEVNELQLPINASRSLPGIFMMIQSPASNYTTFIVYYNNGLYRVDENGFTQITIEHSDLLRKMSYRPFIYNSENGKYAAIDFPGGYERCLFTGSFTLTNNSIEFSGDKYYPNITGGISFNYNDWNQNLIGDKCYLINDSGNLVRLKVDPYSAKDQIIIVGGNGNTIDESTVYPNDETPIGQIYAQAFVPNINGDCVRRPFRKYNPNTGVWERLDNFFGEE